MSLLYNPFRIIEIRLLRHLDILPATGNDVYRDLRQIADHNAAVVRGGKVRIFKSILIGFVYDFHRKGLRRLGVIKTGSVRHGRDGHCFTVKVRAGAVDSVSQTGRWRPQEGAGPRGAGV